ncbi:MAG: PIG-L deacetylase family protein, partial [Acidimicrobiales bacterium]
MPELLEEIPVRALAIYAHPDDPDVGCGGTLAAWSAKGGEVHVLLCTDGDKGSTDASAEPGELANLRAVEAAESASLIGLAGQESLHYPDGELTDDLGLQRALVAAVRRIRPDVVLCPDPTAVFFGQDYFNHRDHRVTGWAVLDAVAPAAALPLYFPDAGPAHQVATVLLSGTLEPDVWVDI